MPLNSEKLVTYLNDLIIQTHNQIKQAVNILYAVTNEDEKHFRQTSIDELRGYKFALEDILEALPDFEQKD